MIAIGPPDASLTPVFISSRDVLPTPSPPSPCSPATHLPALLPPKPRGGQSQPVSADAVCQLRRFAAVLYTHARNGPQRDSKGARRAGSRPPAGLTSRTIGTVAKRRENEGGAPHVQVQGHSIDVTVSGGRILASLDDDAPPQVRGGISRERGRRQRQGSSCPLEGAAAVPNTGTRTPPPRRTAADRAATA